MTWATSAVVVVAVIFVEGVRPTDARVSAVPGGDATKALGVVVSVDSTIEFSFLPFYLITLLTTFTLIFRIFVSRC